MWISKKLLRRAAAAAAELGETTIGGESAAVLTEGENRDTLLIAPGGYHWLPRSGQRVLLMRCGQGETVLCGTEADDSPALAPGEVYITTENGTSVHLKNDGSICLRGSVQVEGALAVNGVPVALKGAE